MTKVHVGAACGRNYLSVNGFVVAMEGDFIRDSELPGSHWNRELLEAVASGKLPKVKKPVAQVGRYNGLPSLDAEAEYWATKKADREKYDAWAAQMLKDTEAIVDADSYARLRLWEEFAVEGQAFTTDRFLRPRYYWEQISRGICETVGVIKIGKEELPVAIMAFWARLRVAKGDPGKLVMFWEATSQVVDHRMIDRWFKDNLRKNVVKYNASNFHNVVQTLFPRP